MCGLKVKFCYIGVGDEEKWSDFISICIIFDDGSSDLDFIEYSLEFDNSVFEILDVFDRIENMLFM